MQNIAVVEVLLTAIIFQLTSKGSDYKSLLARHDEYHKVLDKVMEHITYVMKAVFFV